ADDPAARTGRHRSLRRSDSHVVRQIRYYIGQGMRIGARLHPVDDAQIVIQVVERHVWADSLEPPRGHIAASPRSERALANIPNALQAMAVPQAQLILRHPSPLSSPL